MSTALVVGFLCFKFLFKKKMSRIRCSNLNIHLVIVIINICNMVDKQKGDNSKSVGEA